MASNVADAGPTGDATSTFTLQIISPSVAVPRGGLSLPELPKETTIRQLKDKIQQNLDTRPAHQTQRLIHRGRLLSRDDETMLEIFGEEMLRSSEPKTLHLVLRDLSDNPQPNNSTIPPNPIQLPLPGQTQPTGPQSQSQQQQLPRHHVPHGPFPQQPQFPGAPVPSPFFGFQQPPVAGTPASGAPGSHMFGLNLQQLAQQQRQWAASMADPQRFQELINQNQRDRAAVGLNGAQDGQAGSRGTPGNNTPGRTASPFQPDGTRTVVREGLGPNGQQWRITVNETVTGPQSFQRNPRTGSPFSPADLQNMWRPPSGAPQPRSVPTSGIHGGQLSGAEVQNMLRTADAGQAATSFMRDAMRRNTSNSSLFNLANNQSAQPIPPGVTTPLVPSRTGSAMGTPDQTRPAPRSSSTSATQPQAQAPSNGPEVYILSSPEGPRALLINGSLGTYFTPPNPQVQISNPSVRHHLQFQQFTPFGGPPSAGPSTIQPRPGQQQHRSALGTHWAPTENAVHHAQHQNQYHARANGQAPLPQGLPPLPQGHAQPGHAVAQPPNVQVRAIAIAQIWPHIWMVIRLMLFIWWFTSPNASWQRWFTVVAIALTLFLVNTGLLNPIADQVWTPLRRHLENLMPLADNHGRNRPAAGENGEHAQNANGNPGAQGQQREPNPADTAARLVQERRNANANWLVTQARRLERAGILFLASIAPGVAERHIAHLEAEARAERQRIEAAETAAAEAARAAEENAASAEAANAEQPVPEQAGEGVGEGGGPRPQNAEEPLIAI